MKTFLKKLCMVPLLLAFAVLPLTAQSNYSPDAGPTAPSAPKAPTADENNSSARPMFPLVPAIPPGPQVRTDGYTVLIVIAALLIPFVFLTGIFGIVFDARRRKNQELHQTLRMMIEKGVPIPPELLRTQTPAPAFGNSSLRARSDLRSGLVWIAIGLGVWMFFASIHSHAWPLGCIFVLMGCAFLITYKLDKKDAAKSQIEPK